MRPQLQHTPLPIDQQPIRLRREHRLTLETTQPRTRVIHDPPPQPPPADEETRQILHREPRGHDSDDPVEPPTTASDDAGSFGGNNADTSEPVSFTFTTNGRVSVYRTTLNEHGSTTIR